MNKLLIIFITVIVLGFGAIIIFNNQNKTTIPSEENTTSEGRKIEGYSGKVLAGNSSSFLEFNKDDYEKALVSGKIIFLDFYANWCPICRDEAPNLKAGFDSLTTDKIVGFRVNYNDSETDEDEKALASQFKIPYQHTKVIIKNGKEVGKSIESWDEETFLKTIKEAL